MTRGARVVMTWPTRAHLVARRVEACRRVTGRELHLVEAVVDLPAPLQPAPGRADRDVLEQRDVRIGDAGAADHVLRRIAGVAARGRANAAVLNHCVRL